MTDQKPTAETPQIKIGGYSYGGGGASVDATTTPPAISEWEKSFLDEIDYLLTDDNIPWDKSCRDALVDAVKTVLTSDRQKLREAVNKLSAHEQYIESNRGSYSLGKKVYLSEVLALLGEE